MKLFLNKLNLFMDVFLSVTENHKVLKRGVMLRPCGSQLMIDGSDLTFMFDDFIIVVRNNEIKIGDGSLYFIETRPITKNGGTSKPQRLNLQEFKYNGMELTRRGQKVVRADNGLVWDEPHRYEFTEDEFSTDGFFNVTLNGGQRVPADLDRLVRTVKRIVDVTGVPFYG